MTRTHSSEVLAIGVADHLSRALDRLHADVSVSSAATYEEGIHRIGCAVPSVIVIDYEQCAEAPETLFEGLMSGGGDAPQVVCCVAGGSGRERYRRLIAELRVTRLLFHPVDPEELARQVAEVLGVTMAGSPDDVRVRARRAVAHIWDKHRDAVNRSVDALDAMVGALRAGTATPAQCREAQAHAHRLAGSVGTFGFALASEQARAVEISLDRFEMPTSEEASVLAQLVTSLRRELEGPLPAVLRTVPPRSPALLIAEAVHERASALREQGEARGWQCRVVATGGEARRSLRRERPDAVFLGADFVAHDEEAWKLLTELTALVPSVPVVGARHGSSADRSGVIDGGVSLVVDVSSDPTDVLDAVAHVLETEQGRRPRILALDDDLLMLDSLRSMLETRGFDVTTVDDPLRFWESLEMVSPDLVVLDVELPRVSGMELCRSLRNDERWSGLPVVFLTAHADADTVRRVFAAGGDDYVPKPVSEPELVQSITRRLERVRLFRSLEEAAAGLARANSALEGRNREVESMASFQRDFVAAASHELRTPLTAVLGYLEEVLDEPDHLADHHRRHLEVVQRNARRLESLVSDLLVMNKIESGNLELHRAPTLVEDLLEPVVQAFSVTCERKGLQPFSQPAVRLPRVMVDPERTEQVLGNLVSNAIKFTPAGGHIELCATAVDDHVTVTVSDSGVGIDADDVPRLFERFFRSASSMKLAVPGTGLGLSIAKSMIEAQGGRISVDSTPGAGTTFSVELPTIT